MVVSFDAGGDASPRALGWGAAALGVDPSGRLYDASAAPSPPASPGSAGTSRPSSALAPEQLSSPLKSPAGVGASMRADAASRRAFKEFRLQRRSGDVSPASPAGSARATSPARASPRVPPASAARTAPLSAAKTVDGYAFADDDALPEPFYYARPEETRPLRASSPPRSSRHTSPPRDASPPRSSQSAFRRSKWVEPERTPVLYLGDDSDDDDEASAFGTVATAVPPPPPDDFLEGPATPSSVVPPRPPSRSPTFAAPPEYEGSRRGTPRGGGRLFI
mmetsp:Transcript_32566/g.100805  ORF Transcript_32566/g.100805 Transcript_32566/m.100805 type:complete len:278 (-) Transcript_32566:31-864(-)